MAGEQDTVREASAGLVSLLALERVRSRLMAAEEPVSRIGRYRVTHGLGSGGMGVVYAAYDDDLERAVAIKVLRSATDGSQGRDAMLLREAQALARLSHPNVVQIYEVSKHDGHVFLAMELVDGQTLRSWVKDETRSVREIVARFIEAGRGLEAAHDAGVLHRDFKPENALVGKDGRVRVLDFGLARRDQESTGELVTETDQVPAPSGDGVHLTVSGTVVGTPRYMAPEQHAGMELTPATDQFAFCASLWGALVGAPAYPGDDLDALAVAKLSGPPTWPSSARAPRAVVAAMRRGLSPLGSDRWPTMRSLLDALEVAISPRRRNRILAGVGGVAVLGAAAAIAMAGPRSPELCPEGESQLGQAWDAARRDQTEQAFARAQLGFANATWDRIAPTLDAYAETWTQAYHDNCAATRVRGEQSAAMMDVRNACLHGARRELEATTRLLAEADDGTIERADILVAGIPALQRCADTERLLASVAPPPPEIADAVNALHEALAKAKALHRAGKYADADAAMPPVTSATASAYPPLLAEAQLARGWIRDRQGRYVDAEAAHQEALRIALTTGQWDIAAHAATSLVLLVGDRLAEPERGLSFATTAWGVVPRTATPARHEAELRRCIGAVHRTASEFDRAVEELREALAISLRNANHDDLDVAKIRHSLGLALMQSGAFEQAEIELRASLDVERRVFGDEHPTIFKSHQNIGSVLLKAGKLEEAEREYQTALAGLTRALGQNHPAVATARGNLASVLVATGRHEEALAEGRQVVKIRETLHPPTHPALLTARTNLASYIGATGRREEAADAFADLLVTMQDAGLADDPLAGSVHLARAIQLTRLERFDEALASARAGLAVRESLYADDHPDVAEARGEVADALVELERFDDALPLAEAAWRIHATGNGLPETRASTGFSYARALHATGADSARVRDVAEAARDILGEDSARRTTITTWLDTLPPG